MRHLRARVSACDRARAVAFLFGRCIALGVMACEAVHAGGPPTPLGTAFTYQGALKQNGEPVNGQVDLELSLYNAQFLGSPVGTPVMLNDVNVSAGLFTVVADFGAAAFDGSERWLQISVNGIALAPRQRLTATPYAVQTRGIHVDESANVGIGTTSPLFPLHVEMDQVAAAKANIAIYARNLLTTGSSYGIWAQTDSTSGRGLHATANATTGTTYAVRGHTNSPDGYSAYLTGAAGSSNYFQRDVGIGTNEPLAPLHVEMNEFTTSVAHPAIFANNTLASGFAYGLWAQSNSIAGRGVFGSATANSGAGIGVHGHTLSPDGYAGYFTGPQGSANYFQRNVGFGRTDPNYPVHVEGDADSTIWAENQRTTGVAYGIRAHTHSTLGHAVYGLSQSSSGPTRGVWGQVFSPDGYAGYFLGPIGSQNYFERAVGIGILDPAFNLEIIGSAGKPGGGSWSNSSDRRLKKNICDLDGALDQLLALRGVTFEYINPEDINELPGTRLGMIAQEVESIFPDWVEENGRGHKTITYRGFEALIVEALRELRQENDARIERLRAEKDADIAALQQEIREMKKLLHIIQDQGR